MEYGVYCGYTFAIMEYTERTESRLVPGHGQPRNPDLEPAT